MGLIWTQELLTGRMSHLQQYGSSLAKLSEMLQWHSSGTLEVNGTTSCPPSDWRPQIWWQPTGCWDKRSVHPWIPELCHCSPPTNTLSLLDISNVNNSVKLKFVFRQDLSLYNWWSGIVLANLKVCCKGSIIFVEHSGVQFCPNLLLSLLLMWGSYFYFF